MQGYSLGQQMGYFILVQRADRVKRAQEVTNKSYQSSHSPERQLFILLQSQGGCTSVTHPPGLLKSPALTKGGHKHPETRKQQALSSNSHLRSLFRGGHNSPCILGLPIVPVQLPALPWHA